MKLFNNFNKSKINLDHQTGIRNTLKQYWGYEQFRPSQEEIICSVLEGKDTLALLPTGGGKSICFQVPAIYQEGICIVISPLIALMKDQVANLVKRGISAVAIYSGMKHSDIDRILDNCVYGEVKLLYVSPERLTTELMNVRLRKMQVNLIAVDEAHCISQWGYDFRPSYLKIAEIRELLPKVPIIALTATATPEVVKDIQEKLLFKKGNVLQKSFARSNLAYVVFEEEDKLRRMREILNSVPGSGIVYVRSRKRSQEIAVHLAKNNISAAYYHAGLDTERRTAIQEAWIDNKIRIIVATNAFGMGIDKPDVRIVLHLAIPESLEAYFQEAGRAGRDEKKAYAVLLQTEEDRKKLEHYYQTTFPPIPEIKKVYQSLAAYFQLAVGSGLGDSYDFDLTEFVEIYGLNIMTTYSSLKILEQSEWLILTESVFRPASIRFIVNKEELYDYTLRNRKMEYVIKKILQNFQGAFNNDVTFFEGKLARILQMELPEVRKALELMVQNAVIDYRPQREKPQLIFMQEIVSARDLLIDKKMYDFRKQRYYQKMKAAIAYAERPICRNQQLLEYFGETAKKCGICDVCLGRTTASITPNDYQLYKEKIIDLLKSSPKTVEQLITHFAGNRKEELLKVLDFLENEQLITVKGELIYWKS